MIWYLNLIFVISCRVFSLLDATFTIRYIMSTDDFKKAQTETETREFLPKPRQVKKKAQPQNEGGVRREPVTVKPFRTEDEVCAYVFDAIDKDCEGILQPDVLIAALKSKPLGQVVCCSASLSLLVTGGGGGQLLGLISELFPGGDEGPGVSKAEFVEFCSLVESMNVCDDYFHVEQKEPEPQEEPAHVQTEQEEPIKEPVKQHEEEDENISFVSAQY